MSVLVKSATGLGHARAEAASFAAGREAYRVNLIKRVGVLILGACFWFSVPYTFPLQLDPDPLKAAANEAAAHQGNLSRELAMPIVLLVASYLLYRLPKRGSFSLSSRVLPFAAGYLAWAVASCLWSTDPEITRKRLIVFSIDAFLCYVLARTASAKELAAFGFICTGAVALISLCADLLVLHTFAPLDPDYRLMGVMTANFQAMNLFVCLACGLTLAQRTAQWGRWLAPALALFAVLLFLTRARIGTFLFVLVLGFVLLRTAKRQMHAHGRALACLAGLTLVLPIITVAVGRSGAGALTSVFMMGRNDTENTASLSNRAPLWSELALSAEERPLLGSGFEAFWSAERVQKISSDQGWVVPHAHNTYLDQVLSLGLIGCFLYTGMLIGACAVAWKRYRKQGTETALLPAMLLSWLALLSMTESTPVSPYLPTLLAYTFIVKMCMVEGSEQGESLRKESAHLTGAPVRSFQVHKLSQDLRGAV